ncbi:MAG: hypothetical protein JW844_07635 [Candidatus Omnitrophica bacterium]|nr:hypothetical protein [Candidatus Omnitrophota bacterium]
MKQLQFDFNNMLSLNVGAKHGITDSELRHVAKKVREAHIHLQNIVASPENRAHLGLEWIVLPRQEEKAIRRIQRLGREISRGYENVIFLGIGGSFLGLKAAQDALCAPYYNDFAGIRQGKPRIYFEGNNLDPEPLNTLLGSLNPKRTFVIVISKSGETTETRAAFTMVEQWLKKGVGARYGRQIVAITDPVAGSLRKRVTEEQRKDTKSFRSLPVIKGVGGRYSEFNMGLLHLAIIGVDLTGVLKGAQLMVRRCTAASLYKNPAYLYAALQYLAYQKKGKSIAILMPFSETLKSTADWYVQLLAESLGKKYGRRIVRYSGNLERWDQDRDTVVNVGRTPVSARGTNDLHSIQQNTIEGENNKTVTFIRVGRFRHDITLPPTGDFLSGRSYARLLGLAQEATEWALTRERRPSCTIYVPEVTPFYWAQLLMFFEIATALEGELLGVNAFDQPGVEGYKQYMYYILKKPGIPQRIARDIQSHPVRKKAGFIV